MSHSFRRKAVAVMSGIPAVAIFLPEQSRPRKTDAGDFVSRVEKVVELFQDRPGYILPAAFFVRENHLPFETSICPAFESLVDV